ncbi:MAG: enoyl-CoA hydratase [Myxococcales bacterium]|nr:enoyl-CoA hydratase [Myxococcales bacterium]|tara:strand:+ start:1275 stop:2165 length:891 start_codon:yes stop_codon:yes gene_type:complete
MATAHLKLERDGAIAVVTLNRPEARNALSLEMMARLADAWDEIDGDPDLRVAILTGTEGVFCAGADLKEMHGDQSANPYHKRFMDRDALDAAIAAAHDAGDEARVTELETELNGRQDDTPLHWKAFLRDRRLKKPLIAAVEGYALGGGTEILQGTDLRVAGEGATFGLTEAKWGLFPLGGSTVRLVRQIGYTRAMDMLLTARRVSAQEALDWGLVGQLVADGKALERAKELAGLIAANGPFAVQQILASVRAAEGLPDHAAMATADEYGLPVLYSADAREGARAFREGRSPEFKGA